MEKTTKKNPAADAGAQDAEILLDVLARQDGLEGLVRAGERLFTNPVIIADQSWTVLAMTGDVDIPGDTGWNEFLNFGTLSPDTVSLNIRHRLTERIDTSTEPFFWQEPGMRYRRLIGKVTGGASTIATVSAIEFKRSFRKEDTGRMDLFCRAVCAELQKSRYQQYTRGLLYEDFIVNILEGRLVGAAAIEEKQRLFKLPFSEGLQVFAFDTAGFDERKASIPYIRDRLDETLSFGISVVYGGHIVALKAYGEGAVRPERQHAQDLQTLSSFAAQYSLHCGISRRFDGLPHLAAHYGQARDALRVGARLAGGERLHPYERRAVHLVAELWAEHADGSQLTHEGLLRLLDYDRTKGTAFAESLRTWFAHARNVSSAATTLHMHRNTLIYHLKRACEIMEADLQDSEVMLHIELSFKFLEFA
ncbi:MAG: helix-turn-helix domain-containing protein [Clostridiales Family XIII bacterium]|jgi:hypothetical protein|nr:helix-turn-helix domain-containing protein [Clostridiales Family XIII bacterium]